MNAIRVSRVAILWGIVASMVVACADADPNDENSVRDGAPGGDSIEPSTSSAEQSLIDARFAVGVMPYAGGGHSDGAFYGTSCPPGSDLIQIRMDDEDNRNYTAWGRWKEPSATTPDFNYFVRGANTTMRFCRVDGLKFGPLTTNFVSHLPKHYAVLKLGDTCPNGSIEFTRHIDNEDSDNWNSSSGPLGQNVVFRDTTLKFCYFTYGTSRNYILGFPDLGFSYSVFHDFDGPQEPPFDRCLKAVHESDDEDDQNANWTSSATSTYLNEFKLLIGDASVGSRFEIAQVR